MFRKRTYKVFLSLFASLGLAIVALYGASATVAIQDGVVDLAIEMKAPAHVEPGGTYVVNVSYSNIGTTASAGDTWVKVSLPTGTSFVSAADLNGSDLPPQAVDDNVLTWLIGSIAPGVCCHHLLVTIQVAGDIPEETLLPAQGEIGSSSVESSLDNNTFSVTSEVCDMAGSTKQAQSGLVKPGDVVTYTLTIRLAYRYGQDDSRQREIDLTDVLPPTSQARFLGWTSAVTGSYDGDHLHWQGEVRAGEPVTLQYRLGIEGDIPPGSLVTNKAHLGWSDGEMELVPVNVETYLTENDHMFGPQGGQWQHEYGLHLNVPPNAVQETTRFEFRPLFEANPPPDAPPGWIFAQRAFELNAFQFGETHRFNQPITLKLNYDEMDVPGLERNTLRLWYRSGPGEPWAMLGEPVAHQNGQISFSTDHFTEFALFGQGAYRINLPIIQR